MQTVILAAGKGLRLRPLTDTTPKALIDINGKPLLQHILDAIPEETTEIFLVVGHLKEQIIARFGSIWNHKTITYIIQDPLNGTGGALHLLSDRLHDKFLVVNGDDLYAREDLERIIAHPLALLVSPTKDPVAASALRDDQSRFVGLESNAPAHETKLRVCGAYVLDERFFRYPLVPIEVHGQTEYSLPHTLVEMSRDCDIRVEEARDWQPVGTPQELEAVRR